MRKYSICFLLAALAICLIGTGYRRYQESQRMSLEEQVQEGLENPENEPGEMSGEQFAQLKQQRETWEAETTEEALRETEEESYQAVLKEDEIHIYAETTGQLIESLPAGDLWLPEKDMLKLRQGISFASDEELYQYLESITS